VEEPIFDQKIAVEIGRGVTFFKDMDDIVLFKGGTGVRVRTRGQGCSQWRKKKNYEVEAQQRGSDRRGGKEMKARGGVGVIIRVQGRKDQPTVRRAEARNVRKPGNFKGGQNV